MCGRFVLDADLSRILDGFDAILANPHSFTHRYNIAPSQDVPVIVVDERRQRRLHWMRWGLVPSWAKDPSIGHRMINARAETVSEKPSFRGPFRSQRCVVPATAFYEWQTDGKIRTPKMIALSGRELFGMAGLWSTWKVRDSKSGSTGELLETFTILTVDAVPEIRAIHDRMPRILSASELEQWLDPTADPDPLSHWVAQPPKDLHFQIHTVSRDVNSPKNDFRELILPVDEGQTPMDDEDRQGRFEGW